MFIVRSRFLRPLVSVGLGAYAVGCGGIEPVPSGLAEEEIGGTSSALCTDPGAEDFSADLGSLPGDEVSQFSVGQVYGGATCFNTYVVEALNTTGKEISVGATWGDVRSVHDSELACRSAILKATAYGWTASNGWEPLGTKKIVGTWDPFFGCSLSWVPHMEVLYLPSSKYSKMRVAASAYVYKGLYQLPAYQRVGGHIMIPDAAP